MLIAMEHGGRGLPVTEPLPTVTCAKGGAFGLAYIMEYYGTGTVRPVTEPLPTVTCRDRFALIQAHDGEILFRMLKTHELAAAQGFRRDYRFTGTVTEVTKQIGNAVPRNLAKSLVLASLSQKSDVSEYLDAA